MKCLLFLLAFVSLSVLADDVSLSSAFKVVEGAPRLQIPKSIGSDETGFESDAMKTAHRYLQKKLRMERANLGLN